MWYSSIPIHRIKKKTQLRLRFHRALSTCLMMPWGHFTPHQREKHLFIFCCKNEKHKTNQRSHQDKSKFTQESKVPRLKAFGAGGHISQSSFPTVVGYALAGAYLLQFSLGMSRAALAGPPPSSGGLVGNTPWLTFSNCLWPMESFLTHSC